MSTLRRLIIMIVGSVVGVLQGKFWPKSNVPQRSAFVMTNETNISLIMDEAMTKQSREEAFDFL